jgi:CRISPR-associated endonuclease Cas2
MRKKYLICYDISDDIRRIKVSKELLKWSFRTQKSVYEGNLTQQEIKIIISKVKGIINFKEDVFYIFPISQKEEKVILRYGLCASIYDYLVFL